MGRKAASSWPATQPHPWEAASHPGECRPRGRPRTGTTIARDRALARTSRFDLRKHWRTYAVAGALVIATIAGFAAYNAFSSAPGFSFRDNVVESTGPWRLHIFDNIPGPNDVGCSVTLTDLDRGNKATVPAHENAYLETLWQMEQTGKFRLKPSSDGCNINAEKGAGDAGFPQTVIRGDSEAFNPTGSFTVEVDAGEFTGDTCVIVLKDGETGTVVGQVSVTPQDPIQEMDNGDRSSLYLSDVQCTVTIRDP